MTATASNSNGFAPILSPQSPIPSGWVSPLQASSQVGRGQFGFFDGSGNVALSDGSVAGLIAAGVGSAPMSDINSIAGAGRANFQWSFGSHVVASTTASDSFGAADIAVPFFVKDENTPGKLMHTSGAKRPLGGLVFGIDEAGCPVLWTGPIPQLLARAQLICANAPLAHYTITDAAASTATTERAIPTSRIPAVVTAIEFVGAAVAADNTDYVTVTIKKYGAADSYAAGVTVATYDSRAANQGAITAFTPAAFALSGTAANLNKLDTDRYTITVAKGGSGKQLIGEFLINGKAF